MLKKFIVRNYKNFKEDICIDFQNIAGYQFSSDCISHNMISKMLIYGRNATGKTNLGNALMDIYTTLFAPTYLDDGLFLNADSTEDFSTFTYIFQFGASEIVYKYSKSSNCNLHDEQLSIDNLLIFSCDFHTKQFSFENLKCIQAETANTERYLSSLEASTNIDFTLPFLRWIINNIALTNDSLLIKLSDYVRRMFMITVSNTMLVQPKKVYEGFYKSLENESALNTFETFLNIMGIECKLVLKKLPDGQSELYFSHTKLIPFYENASSGTLVLVELYRKIISMLKNATFLYLDEFDAFYHYEMSENVMKFCKLHYPNCQIIMTTHNTNLMTNRLMRPDCLFILSRAGNLTALCNATQRELREGHNLEKMYISGEFEKYE